MDTNPNDPFGDEWTPAGVDDDGTLVEAAWNVDYRELNDPANPVPHVMRTDKNGRPVMRVWGVSDTSVFEGDDEA